MAVVKRMVCLANSRKRSGRCVAGKVVAGEGSGAWIRPISDRPDGEISVRERRCRDGAEPRLLDILDVPLRAPRPRTFQSENWLIDGARMWTRVGHLSWEQLRTYADDPSALWTNESSTPYGPNHRVSLDRADDLRGSLYLLRVPALRLCVLTRTRESGESVRRVQGAFAHRGVYYRMWVTDPVVERRYLAGEDGEYQLGECFVTVSLGEPFAGYCYKLIAAIITPPA